MVRQPHIQVSPISLKSQSDKPLTTFSHDFAMQPTTQEARRVKNNQHASGEEKRQVKQHPLSRITL